MPTLLAGALLGPLALEGTLCCFAQWCEVLGKPTEVSTPITDTIVKAFQNSHECLVDQIAPGFQRWIKEPKIALPASSVLIAVAMALLRR